MDTQLQEKVSQVLGVTKIAGMETIQSLWSGCGKVARVYLKSKNAPRTVVIKHVKMPNAINHPRGWNTDRSAERKIKSYEIEANWYANWSQHCDVSHRVPKYLGHMTWDRERLLVLEDIDASGFARRVTDISPDQLTACIDWLASFHAAFLSSKPNGLWEKGTYWHLETRPDEYEAMPTGPLKAAAQRIDGALKRSSYQTILHGDAKLANFCFSKNNQVAAVDFQYVGAGCGIKDLAYFIGGCLDSDMCFELESQVLETYFDKLKQAINDRDNNIDTDALETDWRRLYPCAWADFERFLQGWSPGHWKLSGYCQHMTEQALNALS